MLSTIHINISYSPPFASIARILGTSKWGGEVLALGAAVTKTRWALLGWRGQGALLRHLPDVIALIALILRDP